MTSSNRPSVSIITPSRQSAATIEEAIRSIENQTIEDWEHLVIDAASSDGTSKILERCQDPRRHVISEPDEGIYCAVNKGLNTARGEVIGILHADDILYSPSVLEEVLEAFRDPEVQLVYGNLVYVDKAARRIIRDWSSQPFRPGMFHRGWLPPHPTVFVRRELYEEFGQFDEAYTISADWDWLFRVMEINRIKTRFIPSYLVRMRLGGTSNRSVRNVIVANIQIARSFRKHGRRVPLRFFPGKCLNRAGQFARALFRRGAPFSSLSGTDPD